jgi:hypothetical protein
MLRKTRIRTAVGGCTNLAFRGNAQSEVMVKLSQAVVGATGRHDCVAVRGVKCHEAPMTTVALRGLFREIACDYARD